MTLYISGLGCANRLVKIKKGMKIPIIRFIITITSDFIFDDSDSIEIKKCLIELIRLVCATILIVHINKQVSKELINYFVMINGIATQHESVGQLSYLSIVEAERTSVSPSICDKTVTFVSAIPFISDVDEKFTVDFN